MVRMFLVKALVTRARQRAPANRRLRQGPLGDLAEAHWRPGALDSESDTLFSREGVRSRRLVRRFRALFAP